MGGDGGGGDWELPWGIGALDSPCNAISVGQLGGSSAVR